MLELGASDFFCLQRQNHGSLSIVSTKNATTLLHLASQSVWKVAARVHESSSSSNKKLRPESCAEKFVSNVALLDHLLYLLGGSGAFFVDIGWSRLFHPLAAACLLGRPERVCTVQQSLTSLKRRDTSLRDSQTRQITDFVELRRPSLKPRKSVQVVGWQTIDPRQEKSLHDFNFESLDKIFGTSNV